MDRSLTNDDKAALREQLKGIAEPSFKLRMDFSGIVFDTMLDMEDFVFPRSVDFKRHRFKRDGYPY